MPYPPQIYPPNRTNDTDQDDNHPADHNQISQAISDVIAELGPGNPSGTNFPHVEARLNDVDTRIGNVVEDVGDLDARADASTTNIATLDARVDGLEPRMTTVETTNNNQTTDISAHGNRLDAAEAAILTKVTRAGDTMTGPLKLVTPVAPEDAATKGYVDAVAQFPIGSILMYAATASPAKWLRCAGTAISRTTYADLFAIIGTSWGAGDGSTTFNLPNLVGRFPVGNTDATAPFNGVNKTGGSKDDVVIEHTHTLNSHAHSISHPHSAANTSSDSHYHSTSFQQTSNTEANGTATRLVGPGSVLINTSTDSHYHSVTVPAYSGNSGGPTNNSTSEVGVVGTDRNLPPFVTVNFIIKVLL